MFLAEAIRIIQVERDRKPTLSGQLAAKMRVAVGANLDDSTSLRELYHAGHTYPDRSAGLEWQRFMLGLKREEKIAITQSLGGLAHMVSDETGKYVTVGDLRLVDDIKALSKQRELNKSVFGLSFFKMAFE